MGKPLTAAAFLRLRLRYGAVPQPDELPAVIEHLFDAGRMADHYLAVPSPALLADSAVQALGRVGSVSFFQDADGGPWEVTLRSDDRRREADFALPEQEFRALLEGNGLVLPGEPGFVPPAPGQTDGPAAEKDVDNPPSGLL